MNSPTPQGIRLEFIAIVAFDRTAMAPSLHATDPVGTYSYFAGTLNVGGPEPVDVHEITSVTVSPTHRRRGILRSMITTHLDRAAAEGIPVAVLTASEATIYGRFGFGVAAERCRFELAAGQGAQFRAPAAGTVQAVDPAAMAEQVEQLYRAHHLATLGSVSHTCPNATAPSRSSHAPVRVAGHGWGGRAVQPVPEVPGRWGPRCAAASSGTDLLSRCFVAG